MTKLLISGQSVGNDFGICQSCGFDNEWLLHYPSILLWADKLLLTKTTWSAITAEHKEDTPMKKSTRIIFEQIYSSGLIEIIDPKSIYKDDISNTIVDSVENDVKLLVERFPNSVKLGDDNKVPGQIFINNDDYCSPYLYSIYALLLAKSIDAQCLFDRRVLNYCNYKFGLNTLPDSIKQKNVDCFNSVFESLFPNEPLLPEYVYLYNNKYSSTKCNECANENKCSDTYLSTVESQTKKSIQMRNYEEIEEARILINKIIEKKKNNEIYFKDIQDEFINECTRLSKRNRKLFRKIKYWSNLSMMLSVPLTVAGVYTQGPFLTATGAATLGLGTAINQLTEFLQEKYSWTAFFNKNYGDNGKPFFLPPPK